MASLRLCVRCGQEKKESQFRYIKRFDARRRICKRCEALERRRRRIAVVQHVKDTGFTPGILRRLQTQAAGRAWRQAHQDILSSLSHKQITLFRVGELVGHGFTILLLLSFVALSVGYYLVLIRKSLLWTAAPVGALVVFALARYLVGRHWTGPTTQMIRERSCQLYSEVFEQETQARIADERFYASPEWRNLRAAFIAAQRRTNPTLLCQYCGCLVWGDDLTVDHVKTRSKNPELALSLENLRIACRTCNSTKGTGILREPH